MTDSGSSFADRTASLSSESAPIGLARVKAQQGFADVKAGGAGQEVEAALDATHTHVFQRVVGQYPHHQTDGGNGDDLVDQAPEGLAAPRPSVGFAGWRCAHRNTRTPPVRQAAQAGGA